MTDPFADIRPYGDDEVAAAIARLLHDREFLDTIAGYRLGPLARLAPALARPLVRRALRREVRDVRDVRGMQLVIERYMDRMIERSTAGFSVSGVDALDPDTAYLYISNHRDIAMDPAFTNLALHRAGRDTVRIAIGDNLLTKPWVSDLMRLNKSFIVRRSVSGPRELLAVSKTLSNYIRHSLLEDNAPIWIAQREGRAKDGVDRTEPAVIKMLSMSRDKSRQSFAEHVRELRIVPVAISYELDPCDAMKARELHHIETCGSYNKGDQEDIRSIGAGIAGRKGRVHVAFGTPLQDGLESPQAVAAEIDRQVIGGYCLHPSNLYAWRRLHGATPLPQDLHFEEGDCGEAEFAARIDAMPEEHRPYALAIYANAVVSKLALAGSDTPPC
ncbi:MAG: 1-acyl-sn-glycerol-3-phosphate acyltransferase [Halioglobus sp.]|nr:1-acyl-sn-glycerol-3-phosphate acyltransferase [Halioglobus sp.]